MNEQELRQDLFNIAYRGLRAQNWQKSTGSAGRGCYYRGINKLKCAVGHMIPDKVYHTDLERCLADDFDNTTVYDSKGNPVEMTPALGEYLRNLQKRHDHFDDVYEERQFSTMQEAFDAFARENGLAIPD